MKKLFGAVAFALLVGGTALIAKQMVVKLVPCKGLGLHLSCLRAALP